MFTDLFSAQVKESKLLGTLSDGSFCWQLKFSKLSVLI